MIWNENNKIDPQPSWCLDETSAVDATWSTASDKTHDLSKREDGEAGVEGDILFSSCTQSPTTSSYT